MKVHKGSNKAGCFLEVAIFFEGGQKGVIRLPEGRGGWVWRSFVDELWHLLVPFVAKDSPTIPVVISGVDVVVVILRLVYLSKKTVQGRKPVSK